MLADAGRLEGIVVRAGLLLLHKQGVDLFVKWGPLFSLCKLENSLLLFRQIGRAHV